MIDDVRLATECRLPVSFFGRTGGVIPTPAEVLAEIEKLAGGVPESIELVGLCTDICVISNAMLLKAFYPEVPISVDASACAGVTPQSHKNALEAMKMCQIDIVNE